jgi:hypothetical protein
LKILREKRGGGGISGFAEMVNSEEFWWILLFISVKIIMER